MSEPSKKINTNVTLYALVSNENPEIKYILLDNEPLILGRLQVTGIIDERISTDQMKFVADYSTGRVFVEQLGTYSSAVNNVSMMIGEKRLLNHEDIIALLYENKYTYHLDFFTPNYCVDSNKKTTNCLNNEISPEIPRSDSTDEWETRDGTLLVYKSSNIVHNNKIAAFDMNGTLIITKSGNVLPVDENDWQMYSPKVASSIKRLSDAGYKIVIFTNQGSIGVNKVNEKTFKKKIENILKVIETPVQVFIATQRDIYRKPAPGMWNILVSDYNGGLSVDMDNSFFCGDAAGRLPRFNVNCRKIQKDHSCCDRLFAMNIGLNFYTPEEYYSKKLIEESYTLPVFNPNDVMANNLYINSSHKVLFSAKQEMIIMVGCPGSGKSHFVLNTLNCHGRITIIDGVKLGYWQICVSEALKYLTRSINSVVIDNTNPDKVSREKFIRVAQYLRIPCRVILMSVSKDHAKHNIKFRQLIERKHQEESADTAINSYFSKFEEPSLSEGLDGIVEINFVPHFKDPDHKKLYKMFLL